MARETTSKVHNFAIEYQAVKSMLDQNCEYRDKLYSSCKEDFFYHKANKLLFRKIRELIKDGNVSELPTFDIIIRDANFDENIRTALLENYSEIASIKTKGDYDFVTSTIKRLYRLRSIYKTIQSTGAKIIGDDEEEVNEKDIINALSSIFNIDTDEDVERQLFLGTGYNQVAEDSFNRILYGEVNQACIPTGFKAIDSKIGGHKKGQLILLGANSGGGKSLFSLNLMTRQYLKGYNVALMSFEMTHDEVMLRLMSNISEIDMNKLDLKQCNEEEQIKIEYAYREFNLFGAEHGNRYLIDFPLENTVEQVSVKLKRFKPDVIILDYINMMTSNSDEESNWLELSKIAQEAKVWARRMNCIVYLLVQVNKDFNLKYSKATMDHADFVLAWIRDDKAKTERILPMKHLKARNAPLFDFCLKERYDIAQFRDMDQEDRVLNVTFKDLEVIREKCRQKGVILDPSVKKTQVIPIETIKEALKEYNVTKEEVKELISEIQPSQLKPMDLSAIVIPKKKKILNINFGDDAE